MKTESLAREFRYNGAKLTDPSPKFTLQQVRDFYANTYPEIVNAEIEGPEAVANKNVYTFRRAVGTKGSHDVARTQRSFWSSQPATACRRQSGRTSARWNGLQRPTRSCCSTRNSRSSTRCTRAISRSRHDTRTRS